MQSKNIFTKSGKLWGYKPCEYAKRLHELAKTIVKIDSEAHTLLFAETWRVVNYKGQLLQDFIVSSYGKIGKKSSGEGLSVLSEIYVGNIQELFVDKSGSVRFQARLHDTERESFDTKIDVEAPLGELIMTSFGEWPHEPDLRVGFKDRNRKNLHLSNLYWKEKVPKGQYMRLATGMAGGTIRRTKEEQERRQDLARYQREYKARKKAEAKAEAARKAHARDAARRREMRDARREALQLAARKGSGLWLKKEVIQFLGGDTKPSQRNGTDSDCSQSNNSQTSIASGPPQ